MPDASALPREYLLKTLRLNLVPAPRVIAPGPATVFPAVFETAGGVAEVSSLKEVRSRTWAGGFFREMLPVEDTFEVKVEAYSVSSGHALDDCIVRMATRAAYCLGLASAGLEIGSGPGGPWVLDAWEMPPSLPSCAGDAGQAPHFLGAVAEYLRLDPSTGEPLNEFYRIPIRPDGQPEFPPDTDTDTSTWISSPMPFPEMPLCTRLLFGGTPSPSFVRLLDRTVAVLSMLISPPEEARERHAADEGLLGSIRMVDGGFEYLTVPSLLWAPAVLRGLVAAVAEATSSGDLEAPVQVFGGSAADRYLSQKAYYNCEKAYFLPALGALEKWPRSAEGLTLAAREAVRAPVAPAPEDFRRAWGVTRVFGPAPATKMVASTSPATLPVLGIMSPSEDGPRRFGIETDRFKELIKTAADRGLMAFVFFPSPWTGRAWFYRDRRGWFESDAPLPDVIYDRHIPDVLPSGVVDVAGNFQDAHRQVKFVNSLPFVRACRDKFTAHRLLSASQSLAPYLPETILAEDPVIVAGFASTRLRTYLKLRGGTGSRGLTLVENLGPGSYKVTKRQDAGASSVVDADGLIEVLRALTGPGAAAPGNDYIAQEGIDLARVPGLGEVFEVRVICQKGGAGTWLRTGMVCRLNPMPGRFIIPREELHLKVDELLGQVFPGRVAAIKEEAREVARLIPPVIEAGSGPGGEMSVDLGVDTGGRVHLIEVNSKPATLFRDIAAFELRRLSLRRIVNYSVRLFEQR